MEMDASANDAATVAVASEAIDDSEPEACSSMEEMLNAVDAYYQKAHATLQSVKPFPPKRRLIFRISPCVCRSYPPPKRSSRPANRDVMLKRLGMRTPLWSIPTNRR